MFHGELLNFKRIICGSNGLKAKTFDPEPHEWNIYSKPSGGKEVIMEIITANP